MDVKLPKLGEGADSGVVVNIFVKEGETVAKDQAIVELESEKAVASIPSPAAGVVGKIFVKAGDRVSAGQKILSLGDDSATSKPAEAGAEKSAATPRSAEPTEVPATREPEAAEPTGDSSAEAEPPAGPASASPTLRSLARQLGIDLTRVRGSERGGRIVMADLRAYVQRLQKMAATAAAAPGGRQKAAREAIDFAKWGPITVKPLSPLRQIIARRMAESWEQVPRVTQFDEADVSRLLELRKKHLAAYEKKGARLTLTPFVLKAVTRVLQQHPVFNSSLEATGEALVMKAYYHLGMAVDTEAGLLVPVLRDVDKKSLLDLSRELEDLAQRARDRKLSGEELKGGTFTISNQGGIGGGHFTPILNVPEVAILGLGRAVIKPVWRDNQFQPGHLMPLALSYDHRVIDGGSAARFSVDLVQALQDFDEALVAL